MPRDTKFVVPFSGVPEIPVLGEERTFPVRRIWCVGRNYAAHAREMGTTPSANCRSFLPSPLTLSSPRAARLTIRRRRLTCTMKSNWLSRLVGAD